MKMRHFRLLDPSAGPRDGHPYTDPDTDYTSLGKSIPLLIQAATAHRVANGLPIPHDFAQQVETQVCKMFPDRCVSLDGVVADDTCTHRGAEVRREGCSTCGGVQAKIMACSIHGECTLFRHDLGVRRCQLCDDRVSTLPLDEQ